VLGISSLDALAEPLARLGPGAAPAVAAVAPTRRGEVVAAYYPAGTAQPIAPPAVTPNALVAAHARTLLGDAAPLVITGEVAEQILGETPHEAGVQAFADAPSAVAVARLAAARISLGEADGPDTLVPLYVTPSPVG
jgi:tRNA A37 threonylcarbamoyladenosine modification protein TsaB